MENYYEVLKVVNFADIEVVKAAYKALSKKYHPDLNKNVDPSIMVRINNAFDVLGDSEKKRIYDSELEKFLKTKNDKESNFYEEKQRFTASTNLKEDKTKATSLFKTVLVVSGMVVVGLILSYIIMLLLPTDGGWSYMIYTIYGSIFGYVVKNLTLNEKSNFAIIIALIVTLCVLLPYYHAYYDTVWNTANLNWIVRLIPATAEVMDYLLMNGLIRAIFVILTPIASYSAIVD